MNWKNTNVFVTGANGFLGSWTTKALVEKGANVTILIRDDTPKSGLTYMPETYSRLNAVVKGDLLDFWAVERIFNEYEIEACFHLAAQTQVLISNRSPLSTFESNIRGTWNVLEAARKSELLDRIVIASSDKAYGEQKTLPYTEDMCLKGLHPYDVSKTCTDLLAQAYYNTYGLPLGITRCANIYGGGDINFDRIIPGTIRSILMDKEPIIRSDGTPVRDYLYVLDAVDAYLTLAEKMDQDIVKGQAFNFGTEKPISVLELTEKMITASGKNHLRPKILGKGKIKGEIDEQYLSSMKAKKILNWSPKYDLDTGLKESFIWFTEYFEKMGSI